MPKRHGWLSKEVVVDGRTVSFGMSEKAYEILPTGEHRRLDVLKIKTARGTRYVISVGNRELRVQSDGSLIDQKTGKVFKSSGKE